LVAKVSSVAIEHDGLRPAESLGDRLLMVREVAELMRVSNMTVYRLIKAGDLPAIRVGKNFRIRRSDVESYLGDRSYGV
jgi:excisionase family DNA binding protein